VRPRRHFPLSGTGRWGRVRPVVGIPVNGTDATGAGPGR